MVSPSRQQALFQLARDLSSTLELDEVARAFATRAPELTGGQALIWLVHDRPRRLVPVSEGGAERPLADDATELAVIRSCRPLRTPSLFILPLTAADRAIGLIEVEGASDGEIASGGMQPCALGDVGGALDNAEQFARLQETETRFRSLVEQIPRSPISTRRSRAAGVRQPQLEELFAVPAHEWLEGDDGWSKRIHPEDRERTVVGYERAVATGSPYQCEYRLVGTDGGERWLRDEAVTVADDRGEPALVQGVIYDITERKVAEQRYLEAEERYRILVEQLPLAIYIDALDEKATSLYNSPQSEGISGYSHEQWEADPDLFEKTLHPEDRAWVMEGFDQARLMGAPFTADYRIVRPDGTIVWLHDESVVVAGPDGEPLYRQGYLLDISPIKEAEERLSHLAYHDALTGLPNRAMFREHLDIALARAERSGRGVAVLFVDLDDFKLVNDSFGHGAGDELLIEVAPRLRDADPRHRRGRPPGRRRVPDPGGRSDRGWGGRDFDIAELALSVAEQLRHALSQPFELADTEIYCSGSRRHQPVPGRRRRRREPAQARRHRHVPGQGAGPRRPPAVRARGRRRDGPAVDGRPPAPRDRPRAVRALLPAAGRPHHRRHRRRRGADPLGRRRARAGHARRRSSRWPSAPA